MGPTRVVNFCYLDEKPRFCDIKVNENQTIRSVKFYVKDVFDISINEQMMLTQEDSFALSDLVTIRECGMKNNRLYIRKITILTELVPSKLMEASFEPLTSYEKLSHLSMGILQHDQILIKTLRERDRELTKLTEAYAKLLEKLDAKKEVFTDRVVEIFEDQDEEGKQLIDIQPDNNNAIVIAEVVPYVPMIEFFI